LRHEVDPNTGAQTLTYDLFSPPLFPDGHSAFPAHEFYIQGNAASPPTLIIQYDPIPKGGNVLWLCLPEFTAINYDKTLGANKTGAIATSDSRVP